MLLSIQHKTELSYAEPISESVMELRMAPRNDGQQTVRTFGLAVGPEAPVFEHLDWQGNRAHHFSIVDVHDTEWVLVWSRDRETAEVRAFAQIARELGSRAI